MSKQASIVLKNLTKEYVTHGGTDTFLAVDHVNINIASGELVTLLGPSGCGKTTILRMIAGFETVSEGEILLDGMRINEMTPDKRDSSMVFQSYALFPHYDVYDNVAYGLINKKIAKDEIKERVYKMLDLVGLKGLEHRMPNQLSGGQQQRVALARALVMEPAVLLFDEPLSNLDAKLRVYMRREIRKIQQRINITSVYVTHDQSEAMSLSDKIIIMNGGRIEQVGTPQEIYQHPLSRFVADFIGSANFVEAKVESVREENAVPIGTDGGELAEAVVKMFGKSFSVKYLKGTLQIGDTAEVVVRPESLELGEAGDVEAEVVASTYMGQMQDYVVAVDGQELVVEIYNPAAKKIYREGDKVWLKLKSENLHAIKKA